jgi:hypothetical protein
VPVHEAIVHWLLTQEGVPLATVQAVPQPPQLEALLVVFVSQPLPTLPSQLPQPVLHEIEQAPREHAAVPLVLEHAAPQAPQFAGLVEVLTSQPSGSRALQLPKGALQETTLQVPVEQEDTALFRAQTVPQPPQFAFVFRLVSQPSEYWFTQSANPAEQVAMEQAPPVHAGVPLATWQAAPHEPQLVREVLRLASQPFEELPSQSPSGLAHEEMPQTPLTQLGVPPVAEHTVPQLPQLLTSELVWVSHPFAICVSQLLYPAEHVMLHAEPEQAGVPWLLLQAAAQAPQFAMEELVSISQPLAATESQSDQGAVQPNSVQTLLAHPAVPCARLQA